MPVVTYFVYHCWRNQPTNCRHHWKSKEKLPPDMASCPACGSYNVTMTKEEVREK
jgi:hypothetical protein